MKLEEGLAEIKTRGLLDLWQNWQISLQNEGQWNLGMLTAFLCRERINILKKITQKDYHTLLDRFAKDTGEALMTNMLKDSEEVKPPLYYAVYYGASSDFNEAGSEALEIMLANTPNQVMDMDMHFEKAKVVYKGVLPAVMAYGFSEKVVIQAIKKTSNLKILQNALQGANKSETKEINRRMQAVAPKAKGGRWFAVFNFGKTAKPVAASMK